MITKNQNKIFIISILIWSLMTILRIINRIPDFDEAHAWTIAQQLSLFEIFKLVHIEGHTFIWYLLLMPFAKLNLLYPYSMQILNWFFCLLALLLFWKKAPFNIWIKLLLTFSYPFLFLYSVPARCYSLSILFLFLLAHFYKDRLDKPFLYSSLLIISANISAMVLIPATVLGLVFVYDIFKSKQNLKILLISLSVLVFGFFLVAIQNFSFDASLSFNRIGFEKSLLKNVLFFKNVWINGVILSILAGITIKFIYPYKKPLFFLLSSYLVFLYGICFVYTGFPYHHFFLFFYLLTALWITFDNYDINSSFKIFSNTILVLLFINFILISSYKVSEDQYLYKLVLNGKEFNNATIVMLEYEHYLRALLPYSKKNNLKLKDYCSDEPLDYRLIRHLNTQYCDGNKVSLSSNRLGFLIENSTYFILKNKSGMLLSDFQINNITFIFRGCIENTEYCYWQVLKD